MDRIDEFCEEYSTAISNIYQLIKTGRHIIIGYEELTKRPAKVISKMVNYLGVEYIPEQVSDWATGVRHNLGGNRMRWGQSSEIRVDDKWKQHLNFRQRMQIDLATLPARLLMMKRLVTRPKRASRPASGTLAA